MPEDEIARLEKLQGAEINDAKVKLAIEATKLLHGETEAFAAAVTAQLAFEDGVASRGLPEVEMDWSAGDLSGEKNWTHRTAAAILKEAGLATSLSDARRKIAEKAVRINDTVIESHDQPFKITDIDPNTGAFKVQYGRKKIVLVKPI
jgi:tyrosyl-tRNA synthetase